MKTIKATALSIFIMLTNFGFTQNIYNDKFEGCNTDHFSMEGDTTTAKMNKIEFITNLRTAIGEKICNKLRGTIKLQIIVDLDGNSCLISMENNTKLKAKKFDFKQYIDSNVKWEKPPKKVGPIIVLEFTEFGIGYKRLGMNGKKGWHYLD